MSGSAAVIDKTGASLVTLNIATESRRVADRNRRDVPGARSKGQAREHNLIPLGLNSRQFEHAYPTGRAIRLARYLFPRETRQLC